jgi:sarcosine oxidase subunit beta
LKILDDSVERHDEIAIVGAGVVGLSIALNLAERGLGQVSVYERSGVAAEASGVQPGGVRQQWGTELNCLMAQESVAFYREVADRLDAPTRPRLDLCGYLFLAASEARLDQLRADVALQNGLGIPSRLLAPAEIEDVLPGIDASALLGASYCADDGYVDKPQAVVEAFAAAAERAGAELVHSDVVALEESGSGWLLRHRDGRTTTAAAVVVATGYDTRALLEPLGIEAPVGKEPRYLFFSEPIAERLLDPLVVASELRFAAKQLANGRVLASDLSAGSAEDRTPDDWRRHVGEVSRSLLPVLEFVSYPLLVEGFYDVTPDHQAILGPVDGCDGLWLAAGFSGHGFMMAPAVGRRLAAGIAGEPLDPLVETLSLRRFDAESLVPEPQIV